MALDRNVIVDEVMGGLAVPVNQIAGEGFGGHNPDIAMPEHDIERARALLAEAGYPDGFKLTIHAPTTATSTTPSWPRRCCCRASAWT